VRAVRALPQTPAMLRVIPSAKGPLDPQENRVPWSALRTFSLLLTPPPTAVEVSTRRCFLTLGSCLVTCLLAVTSTLSVALMSLSLASLSSFCSYNTAGTGAFKTMDPK